MSSAKADRLRNRLSINPDEAPAPPPRRPEPPTPPAPEPTPAVLVPATPEATRPDDPAPPVALAPVRVELPEEPISTGPPAAAAPPSRPARRRKAKPTATTRALNALDDPGILAGRKGYRSFYVEDSVFARFRAAIYWLSRREDAAGEVPENMSVAIETWMEETAEDLERRYNQGEVFRMPPGQRRGPSK
jgi:hypothetical protein